MVSIRTPARRMILAGTALLALATGAHAAVAIYTGGAKSFEFLRRINIRIYSFGNFIRPLDI